MIDPDGIQIQKTNLPSVLNIKQVPEFDMQCYNLDDEKDYEKFVKDVESDVRRSFEYRKFINFIRDNMNMNECSFLKGVTNKETYDIKIEIHHYPFTLRDIVEIVIRKRSYYQESLELYMVSKEVMQLHYYLMVGLIPLSKTVHKLVHAGRLFIPVDKVMGRYNLFVDYYKPFCDPEQLESLQRIEEYTLKESDVMDTTILEQNRITYQVEDEQFKLPETKRITDKMINQIQAIKNNNYLLPEAPSNDETEVSPAIYFDNDRTEVTPAIYFD